MTSAQLHSLVLGAEENLQSLHLRLEAQTQSHISPLSQELLLETGVSLDPRRPPSQCLPDGLVDGTHQEKKRIESSVLSSSHLGVLFQRGCDSSTVFLFDKSLNKYSGPLTARPLPDSVNFIGKKPKNKPRNLIFVVLLTCVFCSFVSQWGRQRRSSH